VDLDFKALIAAIESSQRAMKTPREKHVAAVTQYVGSHYADGGAEKRVPVNMIELLVVTYLRHLAARAPRVMVSTHVDRLKPMAAEMELALNQVPDEIGLEDTLRRAVLSAIFSVGIVKVGICEGGEEFEYEGEAKDVCRTFVDLIYIDDYFVDMTAKSRDTIAFEGNDYWVTLEEAREIGRGSEEIEGLKADEHTTRNEFGEERAEGISGMEGAEVYGGRVWLRDVYLPRTREMLTYAVKSKKLLRSVKWDGPNTGPYHVLGFSDVPGNLLPLPPVAALRDLHELGNEIFRKLARQAVDKKTVVTFQGGNDNDVNALKKAGDGDGIKYSGQKPEQITVGGIDAEELALYLQVQEIFSRMAGNLDSLGGLGPVADTASQETEIANAAGARMASMKQATIAFARGIWKALAWFEWTDPVRVRVIKKPVYDTGEVLDREWSEETCDGDFLDYNLDVDPFSMEENTPAIKLQKIKSVLLEIVVPLLPVIQQQGGQLDLRKLMELVAKLGNLDELRELVKFGEPIPGDPESGGSPAPSFKPAQTTRNYIRKSVPTGGSRSGRDSVMSRALMGIGTQRSERATLGRGGS
jgi:hypothetical protein